MREHRGLLLEAPLSAYDPHQNYTWAKASDASECVVCVYDIDKCVKPDCRDRVYVVNGCESSRVLVELDGLYTGKVLDCYGDTVSAGLEIGSRYCGEAYGNLCNRKIDIIQAVEVPVGGMLVLERV